MFLPLQAWVRMTDHGVKHTDSPVNKKFRVQQL